MLIGGNSEGEVTPRTLFFNIVNETWTLGPSMSWPREHHACGSLITKHIKSSIFAWVEFDIPIYFVGVLPSQGERPTLVIAVSGQGVIPGKHDIQKFHSCEVFLSSVDLPNRQYM